MIINQITLWILPHFGGGTQLTTLVFIWTGRSKHTIIQWYCFTDDPRLLANVVYVLRRSTTRERESSFHNKELTTMKWNDEHLGSSLYSLLAKNANEEKKKFEQNKQRCPSFLVYLNLFSLLLSGIHRFFLLLNNARSNSFSLLFFFVRFVLGKRWN